MALSFKNGSFVTAMNNDGVTITWAVWPFGRYQFKSPRCVTLVISLKLISVGNKTSYAGLHDKLWFANKYIWFSALEKCKQLEQQKKLAGELAISSTTINNAYQFFLILTGWIFAFFELVWKCENSKSIGRGFTYREKLLNRVSTAIFSW